MTTLFLFFEEPPHWSSAATPLCISNSAQGPNFSTSSPTLFSVFLTIMGVRWHLRVPFTYIFLVISDVGNLFTRLVTICVSSLEKCLFNTWPLFWWCCLVLLLLLSYGSSLCFDNNLIQMHNLQTFSSILEVAFSLCWLCFLMHSKRTWQTHSSFLAWRIPWAAYSPWGHKQWHRRDRSDWAQASDFKRF